MLATGQLADRIGRKPPIVAGMLLQAAGLTLVAAASTGGLAIGAVGALLFGTGTALVYPTLLAAVTDRSHPAWRPVALGAYRFWRDAGYALGALLAGIVTILAGLAWAVAAAALLTAVSGLHCQRTLGETRRLEA